MSSRYWTAKVRRPFVRASALLLAILIFPVSLPTAGAVGETCNGLLATIVGTAGDDTITGTAGDDVIYDPGGTNRIFGEGGNDTICGGPGADFIRGGDGNDYIDLGDGIDIGYGDNGHDTIYGRAGIDNIFGGFGNDYIDGGSGHPSVYTLLSGDSGDDQILGGSDRDNMQGGNGTDACQGNGGTDVAMSCEQSTIVPACNSSTFDAMMLGSVNGQDGWSATGPYDQEVESNTYGYYTFGCKTLRVSNAVSSGSFGDWIFSKSIPNEAGEIDSTSNGYSGGVRQDHFEAQFSLGSAFRNAEQTGLRVAVSPDRGDGSRMSFLRFRDTAGGIDVDFADVQGTSNPANFVETTIANDLDRLAPHTIKFVMDFVNGPSNDIVKIYIDGVLVHTGTSWENYYRYDTESSAEQSPRTTDSLLIRASGTAPGTAGMGFLFDNFVLTSN